MSETKTVPSCRSCTFTNCPDKRMGCQSARGHPPDESGSLGAFGAELDVPLPSSFFRRRNELLQKASCSAGVSPPQVPNSFGA